MNWEKLVAENDKGNYLEKLLDFPQQCKEAIEIGNRLDFRANGIEKIFVAGMGGSGYSGELLQNLFYHNSGLPVFVEHGYTLPKFVDGKTLAITISYSGNTEETLSIYKKLKQKGVPTIAITSGGKLKEVCGKGIFVPTGFQPRQATGYLFFSMLKALENLGLSAFSETEMLEAIAGMEKYQQTLIAQAKELALEMQGKLPVVYATERLKTTALRWQTELNEIAKAFCHWNSLPELQHNEINAATGFGKAYFVILKTIKEEKKMAARIEYSKSRLNEIGFSFTEFEAKGNSLLAQSWHANYLGSLTAFYLSIINRLDPTTIKVIDGLKAFLKKKGFE